MVQNIQDKVYENDDKRYVDTSFNKKKIYSTPCVSNIGRIKKMTLNGGFDPAGDSGNEFRPETS